MAKHKKTARKIKIAIGPPISYAQLLLSSLQSICAPGRNRTCAHGFGGQCSIR
jgi:hypothetical protein